MQKNNGNCITYQNIDECIPQDLADVIDSEFLEKNIRRNRI